MITQCELPGRIEFELQNAKTSGENNLQLWREIKKKSDELAELATTGIIAKVEMNKRIDTALRMTQSPDSCRPAKGHSSVTNLPVVILLVGMLGLLCGGSQLMASPCTKSSDECSMYKAARLQNDGKFDDALALWLKAAGEAVNENRSPIVEYKGVAYCAIKLGLDGVALGACNSLEAIDASDSAHHYFRALAHETAGRKKCALLEYELALRRGEVLAASRIKSLER